MSNDVPKKYSRSFVGHPTGCPATLTTVWLAPIPYMLMKMFHYIKVFGISIAYCSCSQEQPSSIVEFFSRVIVSDRFPGELGIVFANPSLSR